MAFLGMPRDGISGRTDGSSILMHVPSALQLVGFTWAGAGE